MYPQSCIGPANGEERWYALAWHVATDFFQAFWGLSIQCFSWSHDGIKKEFFDVIWTFSLSSETSAGTPGWWGPENPF